MSSWTLSVLYGFHLLATVVWVGGLFVQALIVWPAARGALGPGLLLADVQARWRRVFNPLAWMSLAVLIVITLGAGGRQRTILRKRSIRLRPNARRLSL